MNQNQASPIKMESTSEPAIKDRILEGEALFNDGRSAEAIECFERILQKDPGQTDALNNLGVIAFQLNDLQSAEAFLTKAVRLDRRHIEALTNLAEVLMKEGIYAKAADLLGHAARIRGDDPSLWHESAICEQLSGDSYGAMNSFRRSYELDPSQANLAEEIRRLEGQFVSVKTKQCSFPKKILLVNNIYPPQELGGYGRLMHSFASCLQARGHTVHVLTSDSPYLGEISSPERYIVRTLKLFGRWTRKGMETMSDRGQVLSIIRENGRVTREVLESIKPDVCLVGNIDLLSVLLLEPFFESSVPVLHYLANEFIGYDVGDTPRNPLYHVGAISHWLKDDAVRRGYPFQNAVVIYSGAFVREFDMPLPPLRDKLRIAFAGLVNPYKGPQVLLDALLNLNRKGVDFSCSIAGGTFDEGFTGRLKEEVRNTGMGDHIAFTGWLDQKGLKNLYARHNVLVFPSMVNETFGISQVEAMAAGLAVITSGKGGAREVIEDGVSGLVFEPGDHVHLARHLMGLTRNPHQWEELAETGRRRAMEEFDIELSVDQMEATFQKMLR